MVVPPYNNIYKMYRASEVIFTDAAGNSAYTKRSVKKMLSCYRRLFKTFKEIDRHYDEAKETYRSRYQEMTSMSFWRKYLEMK